MEKRRWTASRRIRSHWCCCGSTRSSVRTSSTWFEESRDRLSRLLERVRVDPEHAPHVAARIAIRSSQLGLRADAVKAATEAAAGYRILTETDAGEFEPYLAESLVKLSSLLAEVGRAADALAPAEEAVTIHRRLAETGDKLRLSKLVDSLDNLTDVLVTLHRDQAAWLAAEEAVRVGRRLVELGPGAESDLARSMTNLALVSLELERRDDALALSQEAVGIRRRLAEAAPDTELAGLARSLTVLAQCLSEMEDTTESLGWAQEAVLICRREAAADPKLGREGLAVSLYALARILGTLGRRAEALAAAQEGCDLFRALAADSRAYLPELASALNQLGVRLGKAGRSDEALAASNEALKIWRQLGTAETAYLKPFATALNNAANRLAAVGRHNEGLELAQQALAIRKQLVAADAMVLPAVADALNTTSIQLAAVGRRGEALALAEEATGIYTDLVAVAPDRYRRRLAMSVNNLANRLAEVGRRDDAAERAREAVRIYRQLTRTKPDELLADTGAALLNLSSWLAASGEDDEALAPAVEAVAVFRLLTRENRDAHLPDLAMALNNAAVRLADQDREEEALTAAEEAVSIFGSLADRKPDAYLPDLAMALNNLAVRLGHCGRAEDALAPAERAMRICRSLAETSPGAYLADLALYLNNLATTSAAVGNRGEALVHWLEVAQLEVGIRERSRALRHLFAISVAERPKEFDAVLVEALASVVRTATAELVQVGTVRDRRSLADETAWLVSAGAVFLAHETGRCAQAIEWLDALLGMEARMVGAIHDSDFDRLQREHPTLATRLQNALSRFNPHTTVTPERGEDDGQRGRVLPETVSEVLDEIWALPTFEHFLAPRSIDQIRAGLRGRTAAWVVFAPSGGTVITLDRDGAPGADRITPTSDDVLGLLSATLVEQPADETFATLSSFTTEHLKRILGPLATSQTKPVVIPVGLAAWLPIQSSLEDFGSDVEILPVLGGPITPIDPGGGRSLVVHSDGRAGVDPPLPGALDESRAVAKLVGVEAVSDPASTPRTVLDGIESAPVLHLACHGVFDIDPWASRLQLGDDSLTVRELAERLASLPAAPPFVALNACETARTETLAPEQALGFPSVFVANGARAVLVTLWPVSDQIAHSIAVQFYRRWVAGATAGEALKSAILTHRFRSPDSTTVDAFCLYGDRSLRCPAERAQSGGPC